MSTSLTPKSDNTILYLSCDLSIEEIVERSTAHFQAYWDEPFALNDYTIGYEHFHARCIGYDLYDSGDYDNYITVSRSAY